MENLFSGNSDTSSLSLDSETNSNSATSDIESSSSSEDSSGDTELDAEGFASLPVTPPKVEIDALGLSASSSSTTTSKIDDTVLMRSAYADNEESKSCTINGAAGTVEGSTLVNVGLINATETLFSFTSAADGSFDVEVPDEALGQSFWLSYEDDSGQAQNISMHLSYDCGAYLVGISGANSAITGEILVHNSSVFYNSIDGDGMNKLMVQDLSGSAPSIFATVDTELFQMFYIPGESPDGSTADPFMLALDTNLNLLRIDADRSEPLNDVEVGDTMADGSVFMIDGVNHVPSKSGAFSIYFGRPTDSGEAALMLMPTVPTADDHSINNPSFFDVVDRTMDWIDDDQLLCLNQHDVTSDGTGDAAIVPAGDTTSTTQDSTETLSSDSRTGGMTTVEVFNFSSITHLSTDELNSIDVSSDSGINRPIKAFTTDSTMVQPRAFQYGPNELAYYAFVVQKADGMQLGISDYTTRAKILTKGHNDIVWKSVSRKGDLIAAEVKIYKKENDEYKRNILIIHLPTMSNFWLINQDEFTETMSLHKPVFATDQDHALSYQMEYKDGTTEIGVINLDLHPLISIWLEKSGELTDLEHIFSNDDYTDISLTEVDLGVPKEFEETDAEESSDTDTDTDRDNDAE